MYCSFWYVDLHLAYSMQGTGMSCFVCSSTAGRRNMKKLCFSPGSLTASHCIRPTWWFSPSTALDWNMVIIRDPAMITNSPSFNLSNGPYSARQATFEQSAINSEVTWSNHVKVGKWLSNFVLSTNQLIGIKDDQCDHAAVSGHCASCDHFPGACLSGQQLQRFRQFHAHHHSGHTMRMGMTTLPGSMWDHVPVFA